MAIRQLTSAEERVARLAASGRTDDEIGIELDLSATVVAAHLSQAFRKLGARSRDELSAFLDKPPTKEAK
jgi:DNA-binding CsgD family transcriptional regulator